MNSYQHPELVRMLCDFCQNKDYNYQDYSEYPQEAADEEKNIDFNRVLLINEMVAHMPSIISRYSNNSEGMQNILNEAINSPRDSKTRETSSIDPLMVLNQEKEKRVAKAKKTMMYVERILRLRFDSIRSAFNAFDMQSIMRVYPGEFKKCLVDLGFVLPSNQYNELFKLLDKDGFGYLTFNQFCLIYDYQLPNE